MPPGQRLGQVLGDAAAAAVVLVLLRRRRARGGLCGEAHAREQEPGVAHGQLAGRVHRHVAVAAQDRPVLLAEQEPALLLRDTHPYMHVRR